MPFIQLNPLKACSLFCHFGNTQLIHMFYRNKPAGRTDFGKRLISPEVPDFTNLKTTLFHFNDDSSSILHLFCQDDNNLNTTGTPMHKYTTIFFQWYLSTSFSERATQGVRREGRREETDRQIWYVCKAPQDTRCESILQMLLPQHPSPLRWIHHYPQPSPLPPCTAPNTYFFL